MRSPFRGSGRPDRGRLAALAAAALVLGGAAGALAQTVGQVFRRVNASVVVVRTSEPESRGGQTTAVPGVGSGVLISRDGKVFTAAHVVQTADEITVEFLSGERVPARVVAAEPEADVALLQLERVPAGVTPATVGDSDRAEVGDEVFVVGAPYGIGHTLTVGHISARHRPRAVYGDFSLAEFLQTDAAINQGNSGGPMFNLRGEVVGIVSHIISKSGGFEGLGFVVTSNLARRLLIDQPTVWTGIQGVLVTGDLAQALNLPQPAGVLVQRVARASPAATFGLRGGTLRATVEGQELLVGGDVILKVGGIPIGEATSYERIQAHMRGLRPGDRLTVTILRAGQVTDLTGPLPAR